MATAQEAYDRALKQASGGLDFQTIKVDNEMNFPDLDSEARGAVLLQAWRDSRGARAARQRQRDERAAAEMRRARKLL